jgi:hypothetical protein
MEASFKKARPLHKIENLAFVAPISRNSKISAESRHGTPLRYNDMA